MSSDGRFLFTVGHGTATPDELVDRLGRADVTVVVDVRIAPGSRRNPHLSRDSMSEWLPGRGIDYRWEKRLGGFRRLAADSPDLALRNESFRAYAGHMRTAEFGTAIDGVLDLASVAATAVLCSETVWWRCHRRLIADYVSVVRGWTVQHLMPGVIQPHRLTEGARVGDDGLLVYDAGAQSLLSGD